MNKDYQQKIKEARINHKASIGTPKFNQERNNVLKRLINAKTPKWGSVKFTILDYPGFSLS